MGSIAPTLSAEMVCLVYLVGTRPQHPAPMAAQLSLLSRATIMIEDLADGYLALTSGTTITLWKEKWRQEPFIELSGGVPGVKRLRGSRSG
ncbi:MAG: hypothetical protein IT389_15230 [Nitrospira sp.]|nr:hypothetical protein [Nitrospira sp.]